MRARRVAYAAVPWLVAIAVAVIPLMVADRFVIKVLTFVG